MVENCIKYFVIVLFLFSLFLINVEQLDGCVFCAAGFIFFPLHEGAEMEEYGFIESSIVAEEIQQSMGHVDASTREEVPVFFVPTIFEHFESLVMIR